MKGSQRREVLCSIPAEDKEIILGDVINPIRQKSKKICVVVDDRKGTIYLCILPCVSKKRKNGKSRFWTAPLNSTTFG